jgi:acetyl-CoA carboxylase biotin carboxyl carrier protein
MAENPTEPHDVRTIHQLVKMMKRYDLTAIDFIEGETKIRLRRRGPEAMPVPLSYMPVPAATMPMPVAMPGQPAAPSSPAAPAPSAAASTDKVIESPMVGTYYASPAPDAPEFVTVGASVRPDQTVCVIEAMKVFTDIPAGVAGTITEVLVKNGQPVEFGQPLFRVRPS